MRGELGMKYIQDNVRSWSAKWIWYEGESKKNSYGYFKKVIELGEVKCTKAYISADTRYQLYINGTYIHTGSVQSQPYCTYYDELDVTPYLKAGKNVIVLVGYYGGHLPDTRGGVLLELVEEEGTILARTDASWCSMEASAWKQDTYGQLNINRFAPYQEVFQAALVPADLHEVESKGNWHTSFQIARGPWILVLKRNIPLMDNIPIEVTDIPMVGESIFLVNRFRKEDLSISLSQAVTQPKFTKVTGVSEFVESGSLSGKQAIAVIGGMDGEYGGLYNPTILLDFGRVITARLELELEGVEGQLIEIGYAERLIDGNFNNALECQFADAYVAKDGIQKFTAFNWRGYRYVKLIFKECFQPMRLLKIGAVQSCYPFKELGVFESNNEKLNAVYDISRYTLKLCSNESMVDTPWREQSQWVGDVSAVTIGGIYACFGTAELIDKYLYQSSKNQLQDGLLANMTNTVPGPMQSAMIDYNFWWVISVWNHYMYTGEEKWIHDMYPTICKLMQTTWNYVDEYGMLNHVPYLILLDWANHDRRGESATLNAIYYGALEVVIKMAQLKHDDYMVEQCEEIRTLIKENYVARFYNPTAKLFVDCNEDDVQSKTISETTNMLTYYFNLCDDQAMDIISEILYCAKSEKEVVKANAFMCFYSLLALTKAGKSELALQLIEDRWYEYMVKRGAKSTYEEWSENGSYRGGKFLPIIRTHSHAWSAGPAEYLNKILAGIEILTPGATKVAVRPIVTEFDYKIEYPLVSGSVVVENKKGKITVNVIGNITLV